MRIEGDILRGKDIKGVHLMSYKDRYIIFDNLDFRGAPLIYTYSGLINKEYTYIIVVTHNVLHMVVNSKLVEVNEGDVFIITPYIHFELLESNCHFMCIAIRDEIIQDIYDHCGLAATVGTRCYATHHHHLERQYIDILLNDYNLLRIENERANYSMKEMMLRAFTVSFLAHMYSYIVPQKEIIHRGVKKGWDVYDTFIKLIHLYYRREREVQFYAKRLGITPKYLSAITLSYCGQTASVVIDNYIAGRIKQMLYSSNMNIKKIGELYNFPNQSFFGRFFKRITGESPYEYQKKHNRKLIE